MTTSAEVREFAARLVAVEAKVRNRATQLEHSALEDGALREFDGDGNMVAQYGKQFDGTSGAVTLVSPPPPAPSTPTATGQPGGVRVQWDGTFGNDITIIAPMDWDHTDIVIGPTGMDPIATPPSGTFTSARGGDLFLPKAPGNYDVALVTRTTAGRPSEPSAVVAAVVTAVVSDADLSAIDLAVQQAQAAADQAQATADAIPPTVTQAKADAISEATGNATSLADAAKADAIASAAADATTKAGNAQSAAIAAAASDATSKANQAQQAAITAAATDAQTKATQAKNDAIAAAALTAQQKADLAQANALAGAATDAQTKADAAKNAAITAAASDATTKANTAQQAAITAAASDATTKANNAQTAAINAAATDAQNKASLAQANAIAASLPKALTVGSTTIFRDVLTWTWGATGVAGPWVIETPITFGNYMTRLHIGGYSYETKGEIDVDVCFYAYNSGGTPVPYNISYTTRGTKRINVRLGWKGDGTAAGSRMVIILDVDPTQTPATLSYPKIWIDYAQIGQTAPPASFGTGWSLVNSPADLSAYTITATPPKRDLDDSYSLTQSWRTTGQVTIDGGKLTADSVTAGQIATNAITALELAADSVIAAKIKAGEVVAGKLAASAVIAGNIATDAVTANTVAAGAIIAGKLAADSVLAANIKAGEVVAGKLAAAAVIAGNIATDAVTANTIAASAVTAGKIATNAVTAGTIAAGAVTAGTLAASVVSAGNIAAGAITAREITIGDLTNMSELSETTPNAVSFGAWTTAMGGTSNQWFTRTGTRDVYFMFRNQKGPVPFKTGDRVRITFEAYASAAVTAQAMVWLYGNASLNQGVGGALSITTTPQTFAVETTVTMDTLGKTSYLVGIYNTAFSTTDVFVRNVSVRRMGAGELLVDGSIIAGKMAANSVVAGNIAADAVTATTVAAGAIIAGKLATDSVLAANIKAGEVVAGKLAANAVIAGNIAANAVTAGTVAAGAITTDKLDANAINGMTITGAILQTSATATTTGGIIIDTTNGLRGYSSTGGLMTYLSATGVLSTFGGLLSVTGSNGAGLQISPSANGGRSGIQFTNSSADTGKGSLLAGDGTSYPVGSISLGSGEATLNSTGRAELNLLKGGDFKLLQQFGTYDQTGISKVGQDVTIANNIIIPMGAAVNTGWITAQGMRPVSTGSVGGVVSTTSTNYIGYSTGPGIFFTAPPSGMSRVDAMVYCKTSADASYCNVAIEIRAGSTIGQGTVIATKDVIVNCNNQWVRTAGFAFFDGLTPGAAYNVRLVYKTGTAGATASLSGSELVWTPCV